MGAELERYPRQDVKSTVQSVVQLAYHRAGSSEADGELHALFRDQL
jgi:hypothetical protein